MESGNPENTNHRIFSRLFPPVPVPVLVRDFLRQEEYSSFQFLEGSDLSQEWKNYLQSRNLVPDQEAFFLKDRSRFRVAIIQKKMGRSGSMDRLIKGIREAVRKSGRRSEDIRILGIAPPSDSTGMDLAGDERVCLLIWTAEKTGLERLFSGKKEPLTLAPGVPSVQRKEGGGNSPAFQVYPDLDQTTDPDGISVLAGWNVEMVGRRPGQIPRFSSVFGNRKNLHIVMVSSNEPIPEHYLPNFFDRIQTAPNPVEAHRSMLTGAPPEKIHSISFQLKNDGRFRSYGFRFTPMVWRSRSGKVVWFPDMVEKPRMIQGKFDPGDLILLIPGDYSDDQKREIRRFPPVAPDGSFMEELEGWLGRNGRGRGILLWIPSSEMD